jgi:RND family efflux transporter MFP subunit
MKLLSGRRRFVSIVVVTAVLGGGAAVLAPRLLEGGGVPAPAPPGDAKDEKKKAPVPVNVAAASRGPVSAYIASTANLVPENEVKVLAEVEGRVAALLVEEGTAVEAGQVLATLVRDDAEIALRKAELKEANAGMAHERARRIVGESLMSRDEFEKIALDKDVAGQELQEARWKLSKTTIRAPFAGLVTERSIRRGQHLRPGDHLFTVADFDPLVAYIYLPEREVLGLREGREARVTLKADEGVRFSARVRQISPVVDTGTGTVKVTVEARRVPPEVRPGAFVTIDVVRETREEVVLLPREAVVRELQEAYVFVAKGETAEKRPVSLGIEEAGRVEALSGVAAGEQIIVSGQGSLKDGSPVKVVPGVEASRAEAAERPARG